MADITAEQAERAAKPLTMNQMADALVGSLVAAGECDPEPAPEVVDVPQPAPLPKTVAHFYTIRALPEPHRVSWNMPGDGPQWVRVNDALWLHVDDLRAMLADIDAQQQPDPQPDLDEGWRIVSGDTAFAMPFGTIRECSGCGCLVSGGPTACLRCIDAQQGAPLGPVHHGPVR